MVTERTFRLTVPGEAIQQGSKSAGVSKSGKAYMRENNANKLRVWRRKIITLTRQEIRASHGGTWEPLAGAVEVVANFYQPRPKNQYGTGRNALVLKADAPDYPAIGGTKDLDKLLRACLDSLKLAKVIEDDVLVVHINSWKMYADQAHREGMELTIRPLDPEPRPVSTVVLQGALL